MTLGTHDIDPAKEKSSSSGANDVATSINHQPNPINNVLLFKGWML